MPSECLSFAVRGVRGPTAAAVTAAAMATSNPVGNFWRTVWPVKNGHVSLRLEPAANPLEHAKAILRVIAEQGL
jgi:hypothetical protein